MGKTRSKSNLLSLETLIYDDTNHGFYTKVLG